MINIKYFVNRSMIGTFIFVVALITFSATAKCQATNVTLESLLREMVDINSDPCFPVPYYSSKLTTSYDRRSVLPGTPSWHANEDGSGFIRYEANNGRAEKVLFDEKGPGVITRIITTGKAAGTNLRIYFDDEKEASITIPAYDISQFPIQIPAALLYKHEQYPTTQGSSFYYPVPYSKRCKITVDDLNRTHYFHANYRTYDEGVNVKTFTKRDADAFSALASGISTQLLKPVDYSEGRKSVSKKLKGNNTISLELPSGSKALRNLSFKISDYNKDDYAQMMRGIIVKITFDGTQTVWAPLSDFSGAGMGAPKVDSWYLTADGAGNITMRFVMPYKKSAKIELENLTSHTVSASINANVSDWAWKENTLYFHAAWRQQRGLKTNAGLDYSMGTIEGKGVFKGDVLSLYNYTKRWYGEGDEHIWVDDESFPSHFGCGTEDYYNTTFAPIHVFHTPFGGAPREDNEASQGYNTFLRTRNLDVIPFNKKLQFEFELISWDGGLVDYSSTIYWYGDINSKALTSSSKEEAIQRLPDAKY